jgi:hypothetical protein
MAVWQDGVQSAEFFRYRRKQVLGLAQLVEIFEEKPISRGRSRLRAGRSNYWQSPRSRPDVTPTPDLRPYTAVAHQAAGCDDYERGS